MTKEYYDKYWINNRDTLGHANQNPQWPEKELDMFYSAVEKFIGKKILDIGAGEGILIEYIRNKNKKIEKIDALEISINAIKKGKLRNPGAEYCEGSADGTYSFDDNNFDTLFMTDVIEHLIDTDQAIYECNRVLKNKGNLIIITPVFNWLKKVIIASFFWEKFFYPNNPHIRFFTKKSMDLIMKKHGFRRVYYKWGLTWFGIMPQNAYFVYEKIKNNKI